MLIASSESEQRFCFGVYKIVARDVNSTLCSEILCDLEFMFKVIHLLVAWWHQNIYNA